MPPIGGVRAGYLSAAKDAIPDGTVLPPRADDLSHFEGDVSGFDINNNSPVIWADFNDLSLKKTNTSQVLISSTSGLDNYPSAGDSFSLFVREGSGGPHSIFAWGVQSASNFFGGGSYAVRLESSGGNLAFLKDGATVSENSSVSIATETWYSLEIEWLADGSMTATLYDVDQSDGSRQSAVGSVSYTDTAYSSGGIGFADGAQGGTAAFDFVRLTV
jgi:hypothetical protein